VKSADDGCALCIQFLLGLSDTARHDLEVRSAEDTIACSVMASTALIELGSILMTFSSASSEMPEEDGHASNVNLIPYLSDGKHHY
jgi:hypothetical protein